MKPNRRTVLCGLALGPLSGCVSDPGASCRGKTVRVSMHSVSSVEDPIRLDTESLSTEAVGVVETAIEDEHVEHCVAWDPGRDETGPSDGLSELRRRIESRTDVELDGPTSSFEVGVIFREDTYRIELTVESSD